MVGKKKKDHKGLIICMLIFFLFMITFPLKAQNREFRGGNMPSMMIEKKADRMTVYKHLNDEYYVGYPLNYRCKPYENEIYPSFYDNWGIGQVFLATINSDYSQMSEVAKLFRIGEAELAIAVPGKGGKSGISYVGGSAHGFEIIKNGDAGREMSFTIDNIVFDEGEIVGLRPACSITVSQGSELYQAYSNSDPFAYVTKQWIFEDGQSLEIKTNLKFYRNIRVTWGQFGMFCVYRHFEGDSSKRYLTNKAVKDNNIDIIYNIEDGWADQIENASLATVDYNCDKITEYGEYGLQFSLAVKDYTKKNGGGMFVGYNGTGTYNKMYFELCTGYDASKDEELYSTSVWDISGNYVDPTIHKLTYYVDGIPYKEYQYQEKEKIIAEAEPSKEGYTFSGWSEIPETMPAHDVTVTGSFAVNSYKLTYIIDEVVYKEVMYNYGAVITPEPTPDGDYLTFEWLNLPQTMPAQDLVIYAQYTTYTTDVKEIMFPKAKKVIFYSLSGLKINELRKGLNIIRTSNGVKKYAVRK